MPLLDRVAMLLRANLHDLLERAEDPAVMLQQVIADLRNQALQVKTQIAVLMTDRHLLESKDEEYSTAVNDWSQRARLALEKGNEALARVALERRLIQEDLLRSNTRHLDEQHQEIAAMRERYHRLQAKLAEAEAELQAFQLDRRRSLNQKPLKANGEEEELDRRVHTLRSTSARLHAQRATVRALSSEESAEATLVRMEREQRIDQLLADLQQTKLLPDNAS